MAGQLWATNSLGGYQSSEKLSKTLRYAVKPESKFRQLCDIKDASQQGLHHGDTFHWNVYSKIATAGSTISETETVPESNYTITQGTLTVTEMANSVPYPGKLDALSEHPVKEIINNVLKDDAVENFDTLSHARFDETPLRVAPTGGTATDAVSLTTNGTITATASLAFGKDHAKAVVDLMKERNIPRFKKDDYMAISWPSTFRAMKNDLEGVYQYTPEGFGDIRNGEIGRYENCRYIEQTHIDKDATTSTDWIFFMGKDTVAEAVVIPEEIRGKMPGDYGRSKGVAWYALGGFGLSHTAAAQARVVKWESAA